MKSYIRAHGSGWQLKIHIGKDATGRPGMTECCTSANSAVIGEDVRAAVEKIEAALVSLELKAGRKMINGGTTS